jgi:hypothetical protein
MIYNNQDGGEREYASANPHHYHFPVGFDVCCIAKDGGAVSFRKPPWIRTYGATGGISLIV